MESIIQGRLAAPERTETSRSSLGVALAQAGGRSTPAMLSRAPRPTPRRQSSPAGSPVAATFLDRQYEGGRHGEPQRQHPGDARALAADHVPVVGACTPVENEHAVEHRASRLLLAHAPERRRENLVQLEPHRVVAKSTRAP